MGFGSLRGFLSRAFNWAEPAWDGRRGPAGTDVFYLDRLRRILADLQEDRLPEAFPLIDGYLRLQGVPLTADRFFEAYFLLNDKAALFQLLADSLMLPAPLAASGLISGLDDLYCRQFYSESLEVAEAPRLTPDAPALMAFRRWPSWLDRALPAGSPLPGCPRTSCTPGATVHGGPGFWRRWSENPLGAIRRATGGVRKIAAAAAIILCANLSLDMTSTSMLQQVPSTQAASVNPEEVFALGCMRRFRIPAEDIGHLQRRGDTLADLERLNVRETRVLYEKRRELRARVGRDPHRALGEVLAYLRWLDRPGPAKIEDLPPQDDFALNPSPEEIAIWRNHAARAMRVNPGILKSLVFVESRNNQYRSGRVLVSRYNALGLTQVIWKWHPHLDRTRLMGDARYNLFAGAHTLRRFFDQQGDWGEALSCYFGGKKILGMPSAQRYIGEIASHLSSPGPTLLDR